MIMKTILAMIGTLALCSTAWAAPLSSAGTTKEATSSQVEQVQRGDRRWRSHRKYRRHGHRHRHYRGAPRGWRRYSYRPYDWRDRGCIIVGPVWFCP